MAKASFIPKGEKFLATIVRAGVEDVLTTKKGKPVEFDSASAAVIYARRRLREEDIAWKKAKGEPETPAEVKIHAEWKLEKAEEQRRLREQFEMRNIAVVVKKRRIRRGQP